MRSLSRFSLSLLLGTLLLSSGCVEMVSTLSLNGDGSGTITVESTIHKERGNRLLLGALAGLGGDPNAMKDPVGDLYSEKALREMANQLGEGVTLSSHKRTDRGSGVQGVIAVYAFSDVTKVKLGPQMVAAPLRRLGFEPMDWSYRFQLIDVPGGLREVQVIPPRRTDEKGLSLREALKGADRVPGFDGLLSKAIRKAHIRIDLETAGVITHTNSAYLHKPAMRSATLLDLPVAKILAQQGIDPIKDFKNLEDIQALRKRAIPGVKIEPVDSLLGLRFRPDR